MNPPHLRRPDFVASDLDGTLLSPALEAPPDLPAAIAALRAAGVVFAICTGRMFGSARAVAARLGLNDGLIVCYQGAMIADLATGERVLHQPIVASSAVEVVRDVRKLGRHLNAYIDDHLLVEQIDEWANRYAEYSEVVLEQVDDLEEEVRARPPTKFVVLSTPADVDELVPALQRRWRGRLAVTRSQSEYIEITGPAVSKSGALQWLCDRLSLRRERAVACGDGPNDVDMLRWAGVGVAVAEATAEALSAADMVVARDGLPALFRELAGR
jgi:Cof subfamily protein (haloacid dehalogenase superfamily)